MKDVDIASPTATLESKAEVNIVDNGRYHANAGVYPIKFSVNLEEVTEVSIDATVEGQNSDVKEAKSL